MKKEFTKVTRQLFDEKMNPTGKIEEIIITSLIPDMGKRIKCKENGITSTRVDLGNYDAESNYEEVSI